METIRCKLDNLKKEDYEEIKTLYENQKVREFLGGPALFKMESLDKMINNEEGELYWCVRLKDNDNFIGLISLDTHHDGISKELSYQFLPEYWGDGYAFEVLQCILSFSFNQLNLTEVICETQVANLASCHLLNKLGMRIMKTMIRFGKQQYIYTLNDVDFID